MKMKLCSASSIFKSLYKVIIYTIVAVALGLLIVRYSMLDTSLKMDSKIKQKFNDLTNKYKELTKVARQALNGIKSTKKPNYWKSSEDLPKCKAVSSIAFAKTHKTGGSTLQNIFLRYGWKHNLTFVLPKRRTWMFSYKQPFEASLAHTYPYWNKANRFDIFTFHSIWNLKEVRKLVPKGPSITILRDPVEAFESGYVYMGMEAAFKMDINKYAETRTIRRADRPPGAIYGKNQLLWDLGLNVTQMNNLPGIKRKIRELDKEFDLVVIAEHFDESLILLQNLLCWPVKDVTYLKLNERRKDTKSKMTDRTRALLKSWMWADYLLYDHFLDKLQKQLKSLDQPEFQDRLKALAYANDQVEQECVLVHGDNKLLRGKYRMALPIVLGYVVDETKPGCDLYAISEPSFSMFIHDRQSTSLMKRVVRAVIHKVNTFIGTTF